MARNKTGNVRNNEAILCNHCCRGKAVNITYSRSVFVALVIQRALRMRHIVICGLPGPPKYFFALSTVRFSGGGIMERKMCVLTFCIV
jgi:hypothetical protein